MRDFNTSLMSMNRSFDRTLNKETLAVNDMFHQMDLMCICVCVCVYVCVHLYIYIYIKYFLQKQKNANSSQVHMEHFKGQNICKAAKKS